MSDYVAWATTEESMREATPGILITASETIDGHRDEHGTVAESDDTGWTEWDAGAADDTLARMGWERITAWTESGGQYAAHVTRTRKGETMEATVGKHTAARLSAATIMERAGLNAPRPGSDGERFVTYVRDNMGRILDETYDSISDDGFEDAAEKWTCVTDETETFGAYEHLADDGIVRDVAHAEAMLRPLVPDTDDWKNGTGMSLQVVVGSWVAWEVIKEVRERVLS